MSPGENQKLRVQAVGVAMFFGRMAVVFLEIGGGGVVVVVVGRWALETCFLVEWFVLVSFDWCVFYGG